MTAADSIKALEQRAATIATGKFVAKVIIVLAVLVGAYCAGTHHGTVAQKVSVIDHELATVADTEHVIDRRLVVDTQHVRVVEHVAEQAVQRFDTAAAKLKGAADTSRTGTVPISLALPPVEYCQTVITAKDSVIAALTHLTVDLTAKVTAQTARGNLWQAKYNAVKPAKLGFKTGAAVGVLLAVIAHAAFK